MVNIGATLIIAMFIYLCLCLLLTFVFLFVDGPSNAVIYLNGDDMNDIVVFILFIAAALIGLCAVLIATIYGCLDPSEHQSVSNKDDL